MQTEALPLVNLALLVAASPLPVLSSLPVAEVYVHLRHTRSDRPCSCRTRCSAGGSEAGDGSPCREEEDAGCTSTIHRGGVRPSRRQATTNTLYAPACVHLLDESHDKLFFVCEGYVDRLSVELLPPALQQQLAALREGPSGPLYDGKLPWSQELQKAIRRTVVPCLAFATGRSHHLLEAFTMDEVLALEKLAPEIRRGFAELRRRLPEEEAADAKTRHQAVGLETDA
ncbi:hypothetical protein Efla_006953 [Eimeria flavescens]